MIRGFQNGSRRRLFPRSVGSLKRVALELKDSGIGEA